MKYIHTQVILPLPNHWLTAAKPVTHDQLKFGLDSHLLVYIFKINTKRETVVFIL